MLYTKETIYSLCVRVWTRLLCREEEAGLSLPHLGSHDDGGPNRRHL